jgi:hypothetical protein
MVNPDAGTLSCTAQFHYETWYNEKLYEYDVMSPVYCEEYDVDNEGNYGLFFFYYPNLNTAYGSDVLEILNQDNIEMNIYMIRQDYGSLEQNHPKLILREAHSSTAAEPSASVFPNFVTTTSSFRYYPEVTNSWVKGIECDGTLGGLASQNRLYEVTVDLYDSGTGFADVILHFDASSVE